MDDKWREKEPEILEALEKCDSVSSAKINAVAKVAIKLHKMYKHVVYAIEKWVRKGASGPLALYVIGIIMHISTYMAPFHGSFHNINIVH